MTLLGINSNIGRDIINGFLYFIPFAFLAAIGISIGIPSLPAAFAERTVIIVLLAPILETILFVGAFPFILRQFRIPKAAVYILSMIVFSLFHFIAYTAGRYEIIGAVSNMFIAAMMFQGVALYSAEKHNSLVVPMVLHAAINAWVLSRTFAVFI